MIDLVGNTPNKQKPSILETESMYNKTIASPQTKKVNPNQLPV